MQTPQHSLSARVWLYPGKAAWHFVTIEKEDAAEIKKDHLSPIRQGFGAIPVNVTIGETTWKTSIFPEKEGSYLLPLKKQVREKEKIAKGDTISFTVQVIN
jgi:hypothetical protein